MTDKAIRYHVAFNITTFYLRKVKRHSPETSEVKEKYQKLGTDAYSSTAASKECSRITISSRSRNSALLKGT